MDPSGLLVHNLDFPLSLLLCWIRIPGGGGWLAVCLISSIQVVPAHIELENNWCCSPSYHAALGEKRSKDSHFVKLLKELSISLFTTPATSLAFNQCRFWHLCVCTKGWSPWSKAIKEQKGWLLMPARMAQIYVLQIHGLLERSAMQWHGNVLPLGD